MYAQDAMMKTIHQKDPTLKSKNLRKFNILTYYCTCMYPQNVIAKYHYTLNTQQQE